MGRREELARTRVVLEEVSFVDGRQPPGRLACQVRLRYHARPLAAEYSAGVLTLGEPFYGVAPGQAAVLYAGSRVLGGGLIKEAA